MDGNTNDELKDVIQDVFRREVAKKNTENGEQDKLAEKITLFCSRMMLKEICCLCGRETYQGGFDFCIDKQAVCLACVERLRPELIDMQEEGYKYGDWLVAMCEISFKNSIKV